MKTSGFFYVYHNMVDMFLRRLILVCCLFLLFPAFAIAHEIQTRIGRYITVIDQPSIVQRNPLDQIVDIRFPPTCVTINDAINYMIVPSGYHLERQEYMVKSLKKVLNQKISDVQRQISLLSLKNALLVLVGDPFILLVDPVNRLVTFTLKSAYYSIYQ